jgi:DNA-binding HxlR family transcriptional regulator
MELLDTHPLLADRVRLSIMGALAAADHPIDFTTLLGALQVTKGNLSSHLRKLEDGGLIVVLKEFVERKPRTSYACSQQGKAALQIYLTKVEGLLKQVLRDGK